MIGLPLWHRAWCALCYQQKTGPSFLVYKETIWLLLQALMKTKYTYNPVHVTLSISPLSVTSVHSIVSPVLLVSKKIVLIKICLTIYRAPIWMPFGIVHKEYCITLLINFLKKLQQDKIWAFKCFQHHQIPFQLIMMGGCNRVLVCWTGRIVQVRIRPSKFVCLPARLGRYM